MYSWVSSTTPRAPTDTCSCLPEKHKHQANLACKNSRSPYSLASTVDKWGWQQWCLCHYLRVLCYAMQIFYFHSVCHPVIVSRIVWNSVPLMVLDWCPPWIKPKGTITKCLYVLQRTSTAGFDRHTDLADFIEIQRLWNYVLPPGIWLVWSVSAFASQQCKCVLIALSWMWRGIARSFLFFFGLWRLAFVNFSACVASLSF